MMHISQIMHALVPLGLFAVPVLIMLILERSKIKELKLRHATVQAAIAAGRELPPELLSIKQPKVRVSKHLRLLLGIMLIAFGIGLIPVIWVENSRMESAVGFIFIVPGIGLLLADYLIKRQQRLLPPSNESNP